MLEALFAAAAEAVFSYILDTLEPAERLRNWLKRNPVKLAYQHALARTYAAFARQYPELTSSLFNESFLTIEAAPELAKFLTRHQYPDHTQLVRLWAKSITPQIEAGQQSIEALSKREDLNAASAYFVELLTSELKCESALQPLFDSRALESLPAIEAKLDALTASLENNLKQALAIANNYQQTVVNRYEQTISNRSGGVDFQAHEVTIGGDVVGRDKIVSNVYNSYFGGDFATLDDLYVRPDAVFQRVRVQDFVGREWLTAKVDAFLNDERCKSGVFLLVGEAGVGKTSFMAHLVTERLYLHLFAEQVPGDVNVSRGLQSLGAQLVARYQIDPYKEKGTLPAIATFPDFLDKLLRLAADKLSAGEKIVIVCDALDEAGTAPNGNVFGLPSVLPDGVYFILSQRPVTVKLSAKADLVKETIDATGADNLHDVEQYLTAVAHRPEVSNQLRAHNYTEADFVRILKERSGGVWMYLFYVVSEIAAGSRAPLDLARLPSGLAGYYTDYWGDWSEGRRGRGDGPAKWDTVYAPLLATLAAAQLPTSIKLLTDWSHVQAAEYEVERLLRRNWRAFISEREIDRVPHFALYHASLRDFLTRRVDRQGLTLEAEQLIDELARRTRDAHVRIVEYYRQQCDGDWVKLVDDDYARTHLCLHLSESDDDETMYQLTVMSNAWVDANYTKEESYAGYLIDLNRAWQYVETETHWNVGKQIRCALIESSIHSLASNISADLLWQLVDSRVWSPVKALTHIPQIPDEDKRADALCQIAVMLPNELKAEALATARAIQDEKNRAQALSALAPTLPESLQGEALAMARELQYGWGQALALSALAPMLRETLKAEALAVARAIQEEEPRAHVLSALAPTLPEPLKAQVLTEALAAARMVQDEGSRAQVLAALAPTLPEPLKAQVLSEALALACAIQAEGHRMHVLSVLALTLPESLKTEALSEKLAAARALENGGIQMQVEVSAFTPTLPEPWKAEVLSGALAAVRAVQDEGSQARALSAIVPMLPEPLKAEVLAMARALQREWPQVEVLSALASMLLEPLKAETLAAARMIQNERDRVEVLSALAPTLPEPLKTEALAAACMVQDEGSRAQALSALAPTLPEPLKAEALAAARMIQNEWSRAQALSALAPTLPEPLKAEALAAARMVQDEWSRAHVLSALAPTLPEPLKAEALAAARMIQNEWSRAHVLLALAPTLPEPLKAQVLTEALAAARAIQDVGLRARALFAMLSTLPEPLKAEGLTETLATARMIQNEAARAQVLSALASTLPEPLKAEVMTEVLAAVRIIQEEQYRGWDLFTLAPTLPEPLKAEALTAVQAIQDQMRRTQVLCALAPTLLNGLQRETLFIEAVHLVHELVNTGPRNRSGLYCQIISSWGKQRFHGFQLQLWSETLHALARRPRNELLDDLAALVPLIEHLGGQSAIEDFFYALRDVTTWWP